MAARDRFEPASGRVRSRQYQAEPPSGTSAGAREELSEVLITVSTSQFETFARDLKLLREHGAESNTRAILDAVRERAARVTLVAVQTTKTA